MIDLGGSEKLGNIALARTLWNLFILKQDAACTGDKDTSILYTYTTTRAQEEEHGASEHRT